MNKKYIIKVKEGSYFMNALGDTNDIKKAKVFKNKLYAIRTAADYCPRGYEIIDIERINYEQNKKEV